MRALLLLLILLTLSFAHAKLPSAARAPGETYEQALAREFPDLVRKSNRYNEPLATDTATAHAVPYARDLSVATLPDWSRGVESLLRAFHQMRDERIYPDPAVLNFSRRTPWLYPFNGCFARAGHMARSFHAQGFPRVGKVFAFGDLQMTTPYHRTGRVDWWFHVAGAVRIGNKAYVLDPSVEPRAPIPLETWLKRISNDPFRVKVALCDSNAYIPNSTCLGGRSVYERSAIEHVKELLDPERAELEMVGLDPQALLGDAPPW